jgi:hypothetical protein
LPILEICGNGVDDDCNGVVDDPAICDTGLASNDTAVLGEATAIELCNSTTSTSRRWGVDDNRRLFERLLAYGPPTPRRGGSRAKVPGSHETGRWEALRAGV